MLTNLLNGRDELVSGDTDSMYILMLVAGI